MTDIERILDFWFGACAADGALDPAKRKMWFGDGRKRKWGRGNFPIPVSSWRAWRFECVLASLPVTAVQYE